MIPELFRPRSALSAEAKLSNNSFIIHFARKVSHVKKIKTDNKPQVKRIFSTYKYATNLSLLTEINITIMESIYVF